MVGEGRIFTMGKRRRHTPEQIIRKLREADRMLGEGAQIAEVARALEVTEATYHRWRNEYGGLKLDQVRRLKELELENSRLRKAVSDLTLDKMILAEALRGN